MNAIFAIMLAGCMGMASDCRPGDPRLLLCLAIAYAAHIATVRYRVWRYELRAIRDFLKAEAESRRKPIDWRGRFKGWW